jgi:hypothetical protein
MVLWKLRTIKAAALSYPMPLGNTSVNPTPKSPLKVSALFLPTPWKSESAHGKVSLSFFYQAKTHPMGKPRFSVVVVKVLKAGLFISTAMTTAAMKEGHTLYRKGEVR